MVYVCLEHKHVVMMRYCVQPLFDAIEVPTVAYVIIKMMRFPSPARQDDHALVDRFNLYGLALKHGANRIRQLLLAVSNHHVCMAVRSTGNTTDVPRAKL